jgi:hypothetical protein
VPHVRGRQEGGHDQLLATRVVLAHRVSSFAPRSRRAPRGAGRPPGWRRPARPRR